MSDIKQNTETLKCQAKRKHDEWQENYRRKQASCMTDEEKRKISVIVRRVIVKHKRRLRFSIEKMKTESDHGMIEAWESGKRTWQKCLKRLKKELKILKREKLIWETYDRRDLFNPPGLDK